VKRNRAREIIRGNLDWVVSWQVVQDFCAVALHCFQVPMATAAAALVAGAEALYSEDLQHGRKIGDVRIENPFLGLG